ncbi:ABC transporter ATP-binding protein [Pseudonocardia asaccharolytica]|uniref:ABC transporter ATP-binding protein n=1 Tax=Pseudonocardia asaccharolytica DSM 44247 = NBRC 16224 TaxID=1123024 RepID=A0A511D728_9PSEU|nr:ABC transporter ATP-binding protein [Pseudonocardia asaccharolytica]GEL20599.1 ABC transporter ATP-binding protein [Pseudonocardia asaccharolytica DSM 44247 = NBRC 16224]
MSAQPLLAAESVVAGYLPEVNILDGCDLCLEQGEIVGIIGPNGAGKSTLVKTMFGLLPVRSGAIRLEGADITDLPAHQLVSLGIGYVPQTRNVFPSLTIEENLQMGLYQRPKRFAQRMRAVAELFPLLARRRTQRAGSLSGGERQVVAMARALMMEPKVLLLDEPSAGLSPIAQDDAFERIRAINEAGVSLVMVEQNARRCLEIAHRGYVLDQGRNAYTGTGRELLTDDAVIELYLGTLARAG